MMDQDDASGGMDKVQMRAEARSILRELKIPIEMIAGSLECTQADVRLMQKGMTQVTSFHLRVLRILVKSQRLMDKLATKEH